MEPAAPDNSRSSQHMPSDPRPSFQFSLRTLLLVTLGFCVVLGAAWNWLILPARKAARRIECTNNLKQIGLGLLNYHDIYKRIPYASTYADDGQPLHSWRVRILPFMESRSFYQWYRFDESWDGPINGRLAFGKPLRWNDANGNVLVQPPAPMRPYFVCPDGRRATQWSTSYVAIVGPGTAFPDGNKNVSMAAIRDGTSNTVVVAEIADSNIHWMEPRDLRIDEMSFVINDKTKPSISSRHGDGAHVLLADGSVRWLSNSTPPEVVKAMLTITGGERINWETMELEDGTER